MSEKSKVVTQDEMVMEAKRLIEDLKDLARRMNSKRQTMVVPSPVRK